MLAAPTFMCELLVVGAAASGKTTLCRYLRGRTDHAVIDLDDEILRLNAGVWPSIERKNAVIRPEAFASVIPIRDVLLFDRGPSVEETITLRDAGFNVVLLEVSEAEIRRRQAVRLAEQGWSNAEWIDWNQARIQELRDNGFMDTVISGEQAVAEVVAEILGLLERSRTSH
jgi:hypothetical protein